MATTSKVKSVQGNGTWNGKDGTLFYRYDYVMEDGTALQASHKEQNKFKAGDEVEYEITRTHETYGHSGSVKKPGDYKKSYGSGKDLLGIKIGHALNCASTLGQGKSFASHSEARSWIKHTAKMIYELSEELNQEMSGKAETPKSTTVPES